MPVYCVDPDEDEYKKNIGKFQDFVLYDLENHDDLQEMIRAAIDDAFERGKQSCK